MSITHCRLCATPLPTEPALRLENVPARIQYYPTEAEFADDVGVTLAVFQCGGCRLIQLKTAPVIYTEEATSATSYYQNMMDIRREQATHLINAYALQGKTVLDVGCGDGHLLEILTKAGVNAVGVDASDRALTLAREKGLNVHYGYISREHRVPGAPFDAFMSTDVIEHVPDVKDFLQGVNTNLKDGAVGLIETPNFQKALDDHRFYEFIQDHLSYFTLETFRFALEMTGFEVLSIESNRDDENLTAIIRKRPAADLTGMLSYTEGLQQAFGEFLAAHNGRRIALWGASLQALTLTALMPMDEVVYIVDSAPYKQGRFTPVSHLPIRSPDALQSDPVDVIVVIAPRYEAQIIAQIQANPHFTGEIATLRGARIEVI